MLGDLLKWKPSIVQNSSIQPTQARTLHNPLKAELTEITLVNCS